MPPSAPPVTVRLRRFAVSDGLWNKYQSGAALTEQEKQEFAQGRAAAEEFANAELNAANNWQRAFRYLSVQAAEGKALYLLHHRGCSPRL